MTVARSCWRVCRCGLWMLAVLASLCDTGLRGQNSGRKIRPEPSAMAARAGMAVEWRKDLDAALADAEKLDRPVFWYLPTLARSPMDRKPVIDRYMMAGPFSWPTTIALLNEAYVPVKHVPNREEMKRYGLATGGFIEPGYVVLAPTGQSLARLDRITTFERVWFETPLAAMVHRKVARRPVVQSAQQEFLRGVGEHLGGDVEAARKIWEHLTAEQPDSPLAWKVQAELEGHGPWSAGFEVLSIPDLSGDAVDLSRGSQAVPNRYTERDLWAAGVEFLCRRMRTPEGGIEDSRYDFGGTDSLPNVFVACTAMAGQAVVEFVSRPEQSLVSSAVLTTLVDASDVRPFFDYVTDDRRLNHDDTDEIVWAQIYRARFACRLLDWSGAYAWREEVAELLTVSTDALHRLQGDGGAWYHEYRNPFATASVLLALHDAKLHGATVDEAVVERGIKSLLSCRNAEGAYSYGVPTGGKVRASVPAAIGRMALAEVALEVWGVQGEDGESRQVELCRALDASFEHHGLLEDVRKYDDHANQHGHGGFFFWYDMRARSEAIRAVLDSDRRANFARRQRDLILSLPEIDGCFVDSHELGRSYGTAMALLSLALLE